MSSSSAAIPPGSWQIDIAGPPLVHLKTARIGLIRLEASAPVLGGVFRLGAGDAGAGDTGGDTQDGTGLRLELGLDQLTTGNPLLQAAARVLVSRGNGERLVFDARAAAGTTHGGPWDFAGDARAGDVVVPMTVTAQHAGGGRLTLGGSATFQDVHIPLPGLSHLNEISFEVASEVRLDLGDPA
ncbi:MAG: hypothetical protein R2737_06740 [Candidatus Nanopelagicales bacterium]